MKKKIAWITDSSSYLTKEFLEENDNVYVLPLNILFGEESYREGVEITDKEIYEKLKVTNEKTTTSQPNLGDVYALYEKLKEEYEEGIILHISSALSGTYQTSVSVANELGFKVTAIDSKLFSIPLGYLIKEGIRLENEGKNTEEIISHLENIIERTRIVATPNDLEQLKKSGRISSFQSLLGSILRVQLIVEVKDGVVELSEKVRTKSKAKAKIQDLLNESYKQKGIEKISILHADAEEKAYAWKIELELMYPDLTFEVNMLAPVIGVHVGPGTLGLAWIEK